MKKIAVRAASILALCGLCGVAAPARAQSGADAASIERVRPHGAYVDTVIVKTGRVRTVYLSGQTGRGADVKEQMTAAYQSLFKRLEEVGAKPADLVSTRIHVVGYKPEYFAVWQEAAKALFPAGDVPAATLVGVAALAVPQLLVEIEGVAVTIQN